MADLLRGLLKVLLILSVVLCPVSVTNAQQCACTDCFYQSEPDQNTYPGSCNGLLGVCASVDQYQYCDCGSILSYHEEDCSSWQYVNGVLTFYSCVTTYSSCSGIIPF